MRSDSPKVRDVVAPSPTGFTTIGVFFFFGAIMASLAAITLLWPGTPLDRAWALNSRAHRQLAPFGRVVGIPFLLLAAALVAAGIGWFRRRLWGWRLAVAIIGIQILGDVMNCFLGDWQRGGVGVVIAGALLFFLVQPKLRSAFN